jgi:hypothetical protein
MTCCAYETTGIAGPLVRYLPPQKLSPPLLTHSLTGSSSRGAKLCDLITDRNRPRYGESATIILGVERHHDDRDVPVLYV